MPASPYWWYQWDSRGRPEPSPPRPVLDPHPVSAMPAPPAKSSLRLIGMFGSPLARVDAPVPWGAAYAIARRRG
ncbi:hypothetical protein GCM10010324_15500 [Streptomyces hiroshimensis]|uniref:Uncharacterized protein n=1 Tax=Streptomyces hiroshimensis TaxID=66424 RepID=A0ABQ2Y9K6_9ACTN|nr:hypothetical protein GCM10010324_15500 [Streptomyces hiroshimensis]